MEYSSILLKPRPLKAPLIASGIWLSNPHSALQPGEEQGGELEAGGVKLLLAEALTVLCTE